LEKLDQTIQCSGLPFLDGSENAKWLARLSDEVLQKMTAALWRQRPQKERIAGAKDLKERGQRVRGQKDKVEIELVWPKQSTTGLKFICVSPPLPLSLPLSPETLSISAAWDKEALYTECQQGTMEHVEPRCTDPPHDRIA